MPIEVKETPEPLTAAAELTPPDLAECEAYRVLLHDLMRYGQRETMGRSILIAGHRGSGKTTRVRWAIQQAQSKLERIPGAARPLLVPLHGPDLLGGEKVLELMPSEVQQNQRKKADAIQNTSSQKDKPA